MQKNIVLHNWLSRRKISDSVISEFNVHWGKHPILGECIVIPVNNPDGSFAFNKYRRSPLDDTRGDKPKYLYDAGSKTALYGLHAVRESDKVVFITEGEMDCLVARSANICSVSSTGGALSFQKEWASAFSGKEVVLCFDNDKAGGEGMVRAMEELKEGGFTGVIKVVLLPDRAGVKDISDYVASGGDIGELMKTARGFADMGEVVDDKSVRQATWRSTYFHDAYIKHHTKPEPKPIGGVVDGMKGKTIGKARGMQEKIYSAKAYPIDQLMTFVRRKAKCLWHNEDTESLHYYKDTNSVFCFGMCGRAYDSIDVYMKIKECRFKEAVDDLAK